MARAPGRRPPRPARTSTGLIAGLALARNRGFRADARQWHAEHAGHPGVRDGRLLLEDEERIGHRGAPAAAADGYTAVAQVLTRLFGVTDHLAEAALRSSSFWTEQAARPVRLTRSGGDPSPLTGFRTVGIELGADFCTVAHRDGERLVPVPNAEGTWRTPSVVAYTDGGVLVGEPARRQAVSNPDRTFALADRWWETAASSPITLDEVYAEVLRKLRRDAEAELGERVVRAVLAVPAGLPDSERKRIRAACRQVGLEPMRLISGPLAAGLALAHRLGNPEAVALVAHFGEASLDLACLVLGDGVVEVRSVISDVRLGSGSWTSKLADGMRREFERLHAVLLPTDRTTEQRIREAAAQAIADFATVDSAAVRLPHLVTGSGGSVDVEYQVTRLWFGELMADRFAELDTVLRRLLEEADIEPDDEADHVLSIGAAARIPGLAEVLRRHSKGQQVNTGVFPERLIAQGAALQAGILTGEVKDVLSMDVMPRTVGLALADGGVLPLLERNTFFPATCSVLVTTSVADQPQLVLDVLTGDHPDPLVLAGRLTLADLPPLPRGLPRIEVTIDVDANGVLAITAKDLGTGDAVGIDDLATAEPPVVPALRWLPARTEAGPERPGSSRIRS
ncbi:Hsp70 family protein [Kitasatospora saccharophila]|uniref:Hsp70 family protein n=1 Tax=Kitasatospora saccharophila TaxID=407973 RepID=UPI00362C6805